MKPIAKGCFVLLASLVAPGPLRAHHSLVNFDTTTPVRVAGTIVAVHLINPHSFIYLNETAAGGTRRRWAVEGPALLQLNRMGFSTDALKPGVVVEACGYLPKEHIIWQIRSADPGATSLAGRLLNGELLVLAGGRELSWGDYGVHRCFAPGHRDRHSPGSTAEIPALPR